MQKTAPATLPREFIHKATLDHLFNYTVDKHQNRTAIIFENMELSYTNLKAIVNTLAVRLSEMGVGKGDKVAILLPNCYEYLCLYFAIFILGAWAVPINSRSKIKELKGILDDCEPKVLIAENVIENREYGKFLYMEREQYLATKIVLRGHKPYDSMTSFDDFVRFMPDPEQHFKRIDRPEIDEYDTALLAYTSGTTGNPKGVMINHRGLVLTSSYVSKIGEFTRSQRSVEDVALSIAPLYAAQGFLAVLIDFLAGVTMNWISSFNPNDIIRTISQGKANIIHTQPTMWSLLLSSPLLKFARLDKIKLTVVSGSLCSSRLAQEIEEKIQSTIYNIYGLIEATGAVTMTRPGDSNDIRWKTVGRPIDGVEFRIVDANRNDLPRGDVGELALKGYLMNGYYKNEQGTKVVIDEEGWLYTGDLARIYDDQDNIQIVGRAKDMIVRGGFNVYPSDIEEELLELDGIQDVAIVGKEVELLGECTIAFIVPKPGYELSKSKILAYCKDNISDFKSLDEIHFLKQLPTLISGKVQKNVLCDWAKDGIPEEEMWEELN